MLVRVDPSSSSPLHEQIAANIRRNIADGKLEEGERLPAAKALAEALGVHLHTVLRAYRELEQEDVVEVRRGRGATRVRRKGEARAGVAELARALAREAKRHGYSKRETISLIEDRW